jgi:hypothetical protein
MHIFIKDKVTGEAKTVHLKMDESNYRLSISRDQHYAGWLEIWVMNDCLFVEAYHPGKGVPEVIQIGNSIEQEKALQRGPNARSD